MSTRLVALVRQTDIRPKTRHSAGLPAQLSDDGSPGEALPWPRVIVLETRADGIFLDRYAEDGQFAGDTWHMSLDDAKDQAADEYGELLSPWHDLPPDVNDDNVVSFALNHFS